METPLCRYAIPSSWPAKRSLYCRARQSIRGFRCALETLRAQVPLMRPLPPLAHDHWVIHLRSGDVFCGVGHRLYGQPLLAFYCVVLRLAPWRRVIVVCADNANPVIDSLLAEAAHAVPSVVWELATLEQDLDRLLRARSLVCSRGTFLPAVLALSANVKRIFCFEGLWCREAASGGC